MTGSFEEDGVKTETPGKGHVRTEAETGGMWLLTREHQGWTPPPPSSVEEAEKDSIQSWREHGSDDTLVWALEAPELWEIKCVI